MISTYYSHGETKKRKNKLQKENKMEYISNFTFTNILLPTDDRVGLLGVQYTDMDFRSLENSRVNSFFISCLMTWRIKILGYGFYFQPPIPHTKILTTTNHV